MKAEKDICYSDISPLDKLDIYFANQEKGILIYFHGGGLEEGDKCDPHIVEIAESFSHFGYTFVSVDYSLYPNTKFPSFLLESALAVKYIKERFPHQKIYISGTSAGAYISMMLCFDRSLLERHHIKPLDISGWIFESGQPTSHFNLLKFEKGLDPLLQRIDELAPLYYVDKEVLLSKALFILYSDDMPNRYEQNQLMIKAVKNFNPSLQLDQILLEGTHCVGSSVKDKDGLYPYVKITTEWLER